MPVSTELISSACHSMALGEAGIHPKQISRKQARLLAAGPRSNLDDHVLLVVGVLGQQHDSEFILEAGDLLFEVVELELRKLAHLVVETLGEHLLGIGELLPGLLILPPLANKISARSE